MKKKSEIEFAIDYFRGHTDEEFPVDMSSSLEKGILNKGEITIVIDTLEWVMGNGRKIKGNKK